MDKEMIGRAVYDAFAKHIPKLNRVAFLCFAERLHRAEFFQEIPPPQLNAIANDYYADAEPWFKDAEGCVTLYRGMSEDEARLISSREYDSVGVFWTRVANKAAGYAWTRGEKRRSFLCAIRIPASLIKIASDRFSEVRISAKESLPQALSIRFYKVLPFPRWARVFSKRGYRPYIRIRCNAPLSQ